MKKLLIVFILFFQAFIVFGQKEHAIMLGFSPAVTIEPEYPSGAFDLNVFPIAIQYPSIIDNLDIRFLGLLNYGIRSYGSALINIGGEICLPYHFDFGPGHPVISKGFFIGPGAAFARNVHYNHTNYSVFFEPGYHFLFNDNFSLIIDMQYGRTFFNYDSGQQIVKNHFGVKVVLGWWIAI
jgi:hypothetical protein